MSGPRMLSPIEVIFQPPPERTRRMWVNPYRCVIEVPICTNGDDRLVPRYAPPDARCWEAP